MLDKLALYNRTSQNSKNTFFTEYPWATASKNLFSLCNNAAPIKQTNFKKNQPLKLLAKLNKDIHTIYNTTKHRNYNILTLKYSNNILV